MEEDSDSWYEFCATEGEECMCDGDIYYGAYLDEELDFEQDWVTMSSDESGLTGCNNDYFTDPLPGVGKACFCVYEWDNDSWDFDYDYDYDYDMDNEGEWEDDYDYDMDNEGEWEDDYDYDYDYDYDSDFDFDVEDTSS
jgi:hypothetical protein